MLTILQYRIFALDDRHRNIAAWALSREIKNTSVYFIVVMNVFHNNDDGSNNNGS